MLVASSEKTNSTARSVAVPRCGAQRKHWHSEGLAYFFQQGGDGGGGELGGVEGGWG
jgi:hypothetical protein